MKKYDPQMHTAEHVLNRTMVLMFGCERSFSSHLEKKKSKCDYRFHRDLTADEGEALAREVNAVLKLNLAVTESRISKTEASENFNLSRLPDGAGDTIRIVSVGDYDHCPCIGDHVLNTSEVGCFVLVSTSFSDGVLRIRFKLKH